MINRHDIEAAYLKRHVLISILKPDNKQLLMASPAGMISGTIMSQAICRDFGFMPSLG